MQDVCAGRRGQVERSESMKEKPMFVSLGVMAAVAAGTKISSSVNFAADFRAKI